MVENDFSPPDSVFVCLPFALALVSSGSTYDVIMSTLSGATTGCTRGWKMSYM